MSRFMVSAANPTLMRSRNATKYSSMRKGISRQVILRIARASSTPEAGAAISLILPSAPGPNSGLLIVSADKDLSCGKRYHHRSDGDLASSKSKPPCWRSNSATSSWSLAVAQCKGVEPRFDLAFTLAPCANSNTATSLLPFDAAQVRGVKPLLSLASMCALLESSKSATSVEPAHAAQYKGVPPFRLMASSLAPWASSNSATSRRPLYAAVCSGV